MDFFVEGAYGGGQEVFEFVVEGDVLGDDVEVVLAGVGVGCAGISFDVEACGAVVAGEFFYGEGVGFDEDGSVDVVKAVGQRVGFEAAVDGCDGGSVGEGGGCWADIVLVGGLFLGDL